MRLSDSGLVRFKDDLGSVSVHMQGSENENQTWEGRVGWDSLQPIIIQIKQYHLWFSGFQDHVSELLYLYRVARQSAWIINKKKINKQRNNFIQVSSVVSVLVLIGGHCKHLNKYRKYNITSVVELELRDIVEKNPKSSRMEYLNKGHPDFKSSALNWMATPPPPWSKCSINLLQLYWLISEHWLQNTQHFQGEGTR